MIYIASVGAVVQNAVEFARGLHLALKSCKGGPLFRTLLSGPFCPATNARQRPRHADRSEKKGGLLLCPTHLAWQSYLTQPMSTRRQSTCHHAMYLGQRVPPNAASLHEQRSCTSASWLMLRIQQIMIPSQMQGSCSGSGSDGGSGSGSGRSSGSGIGSGSSSSEMQQAVPSPLAVPMWRQPVLLHQRRKNFAGQECAQANAQLGHCLPLAIHVDAESTSAPVPHLLSEGDFFPTDTEAALKQEGKEQC